MAKVHPYTNARLDKPVLYKPEAPVLTIVVDTEEEFDWNAPFSRENTATSSALKQDYAHDIFDPLGIKPTYVIDQAIVDDDKASAYFESLYKDRKCEIGAHLHAWLTKPFHEAVNNRNSYQGNLPPDIEYQKIRTLRDSIVARFGVQPRVFKAGRYGLGPKSLSMIKKLGFDVDCSVVPHTSYEGDEGPNFIGLPEHPFWVDDEQSLLEVPLTRGYTGLCSFAGTRFDAIFDHALFRKMRGAAFLSRSHLLRRITLTPEGVPVQEQKRLLKKQYDAGARYFSLAYHSSSLGVGNTSYVQSQNDLKAFLASLQDICLYFEQELGGHFMSVAEIYDMIV